MNTNENTMEMNKMEEQLNDLIATATTNNEMLQDQLKGLSHDNCDERELYILTLKMDHQLDSLDKTMTLSDEQEAGEKSSTAKNCGELLEHGLAAIEKFNSKIEVMKTQIIQREGAGLPDLIMAMDILTQDQKEWLQEIKGRA